LARLIVIDGTEFEHGGHALRSALTLSAVTGSGFEARRIGEGLGRRGGLKGSHVAAVRAAAMACQARLAGAFEGSLELRFEPNPASAGEFEFDLGGFTPATLVLQAVVPILSRAASESALSITGGTHVPASPSYEFLERHWLVLASQMGFATQLSLARAGFKPKGGGQLRARVSPQREGQAILADRRGALLRIVGVAGGSRLKGDAARRLQDAAQGYLWEQRRLESVWETLDLPATSPGLFGHLDLVFEGGRAGFDVLGERAVRPEVMGARLARACLRFLDGEGVVDRYVADQLVVPMAAGRGGGRASTDVVTDHLLVVAEIARLFGFKVSVWGTRGGPGGVEVERS
jgi:RNA 3'-terminal phosphate cyclase (ATP)